MSETTTRRSPLHRVPETATDGLTEHAFLGQIVLRGDPGQTGFCEAVRDATGLELPVEPNTLSLREGVRIAWLGPSEWMITLPPGAEGAMRAKLERTLADQHVSVVDVTDGYTTLVLEDPAAGDILARECPLDFHPRGFAVGSCAQSVLGKAGALFVRETEQRFVLVIRRSFAEYQWALLIHATDLVRRCR